MHQNLTIVINGNNQNIGKIHIWQFRKKLSDVKLSKLLNVTRQSFALKKRNNDFAPNEIETLESNGFLNIK